MGTSRGSTDTPAPSSSNSAPTGETSRSYRVVFPSHPGEWDPLIATQDACLLQSWKWGEFKQGSGWSPMRLGIEAQDGALIYGQVLYRSVPHLPLPLSIAYIPRGPIYFPAAQGDKDAEKAFWRAVHHESRKRGAIFLKVEPNIAITGPSQKIAVNRKMAALRFEPSGRLQPARTWVLDISRSEDDILKGMKPKTRYNLRLAGKRGVVVRRAASLSDLRTFHALLEVTGERDEFGIHTFPYYEQLWHIFGPDRDDSIVVLLADHPNEAERSMGPIGGLLAFRFGSQAIYMYGASDNRGREHMPNYLLQWEAIKWAREHGCTLYDFWGIPDPPAESADGEEGKSTDEVSPINARSGLRGVYWFKRGFGGREIEYPGAYDHIYNALLYKIWMRWRGQNLGG